METDDRNETQAPARTQRLTAITITPLQQWGEACVDGTRMTVSALVAFVEQYGRAEVKRDYHMTDDQIDVALWFAAAYRLQHRKAFVEATRSCPLYRRAWKLDERETAEESAS